MLQRIDAQAPEAVEVKILNVHGRGLHDNLELVVMLQPVGIFAVAAILGAARGLYIGHIPRLGPEAPEKGCLVKCARPDFHVIGLLQHAVFIGPVGLKGQYHFLKRHKKSSCNAYIYLRKLPQYFKRPGPVADVKLEKPAENTPALIVGNLRKIKPRELCEIKTLGMLKKPDGAV